ncbi:hypothetical protein [Aquimarina latercula]|uniref:hypothetical protein n=1 Tax=Aquimarina latercula TaxID=987 RepID=UPI00041DDEE8|nr:hypothetical protein [Aquimarina latercula]
MSETIKTLENLASLVLESIKQEKNISQKLKSPLRDQILKGEIKKITDLEKKAEQLLENGVIDIYAEQIDSKYIREIEYLRIKANYYQSNVLPSIDVDQEVVYVYATHIYLKDFLEKELQQFTGDILDVIALENLEKEKEREPLVSDNGNHLGLYDDHGLPPFKENRKKGTPVFKPSIISSLCNIIELYFSEQDFSYVGLLLETAQNVPKKVVFLSEGNKLADIFWQLYENKLVFNCNKMQLEQWIVANFQYLDRSNAKDFTLKYLNKIISTDHQMCKNPILSIKSDSSTGEKLLKIT